MSLKVGFWEGCQGCQEGTSTYNLEACQGIVGLRVENQLTVFDLYGDQAADVLG
jgi:hypothetical protein